MKKVSIDWSSMRSRMADKKKHRARSKEDYSALFKAAALQASFSTDDLLRIVPLDSIDESTLKEESAKIRKLSNVVYDSGNYKWQLKDEIRKEVLNSIKDLKQMQDYLPAIDVSDKDGIENASTLQLMLNHYIKGDAKELKEQSIEELGASIQIHSQYKTVINFSAT